MSVLNGDNINDDENAGSSIGVVTGWDGTGHDKQSQGRYDVIEGIPGRCGGFKTSCKRSHLIVHHKEFALLHVLLGCPLGWEQLTEIFSYCNNPKYHAGKVSIKQTFADESYRFIKAFR